MLSSGFIPFFYFFLQIFGKTLEESIDKEFSGELQTALLTMGGYCCVGIELGPFLFLVSL